MIHIRSIEMALPRLVALGVSAAVAERALNVLARCKTVADLLSIVGPPDRIAEWTPEDEAFASKVAADGKRVERFIACYCYETKWAPLSVQVSEGEDRRFSFTFSVDPRD